ncbi:hypothetical protein [Chitinophaga solisilvae]|uniref:hypothetical protein n=1 Tax=Chitinophaga solisilvae TaxID=1233460 RepID=UPI0013695ABC|nr:hypothetical protein [Chitinophaga solisilvae]
MKVVSRLTIVLSALALIVITGRKSLLVAHPQQATIMAVHPDKPSPQRLTYDVAITLKYIYGATPLDAGTREGQQILKTTGTDCVRVNDRVVHLGNKYYCYFHYECPDGSYDGPYYEINESPCFL